MAAQVNGDTPSISSAFLGHLISYPVISDSIKTFKSNPYAAKSLDITQAGYERLGKPLLPYLSRPYQYVSPYLQKADSLGDSTLSGLDARFPVVKKPTGELYDEGKSIITFPLRKGTEGKEYVFGVFGSEKKKVGQDGLVGYGKAVVSTGYVVTNDVIQWVSEFLAGKKAEAKEAVSAASEKLSN